MNLADFQDTSLRSGPEKALEQLLLLFNQEISTATTAALIGLQGERTLLETARTIAAEQG